MRTRSPGRKKSTGRPRRLPLVHAFFTIFYQRRDFASTGDWLVRFWDGALRRAPILRAWERSPVWRVRAAGHREPFVVRKASKDWVALRETIFRGEYELVFSHMETCKGTILDLGANIGLSVRTWLHQFPEARVVAVEPDPGNFELCRLNVAAAGASERARLLDWGVGARRERGYLDRSGEPMEYHTFGTRNRQSIEIPVRPVDDILEVADIDFVDLMKCDIEGAEGEIFRQCEAWIGKIGLLVAELHAPYDHERLLDDLRRNGARPEILVREEKSSGTELVLIDVNSHAGRSLEATSEPGEIA